MVLLCGVLGLEVDGNVSVPDGSLLWNDSLLFCESGDFALLCCFIGWIYSSLIAVAVIIITIRAKNHG